MSRISPTIGRIVWFYPAGLADIDAQVQPLAAQIAYVHSESVINIGYLTPSGASAHATSVTLHQHGDEYPSGGFCQWMPFQVGQAKKETGATAGDVNPSTPGSPT